MKKLLIAGLACLSSLCAVVVHAGALVDVAVVNRSSGERIPVWRHHGRFYAAGTPGEKYSVLVTNRISERLLTVVSVDGINVVTGETATPAQSGYILDPWGSVDIAGWRKNMSEVAAFVFTALPDSYAARTDRPGNVGVIGVAVFREFNPPRPPAVSQLQQPLASSGSPDAERHEPYKSADEASGGARARDTAPAAPSSLARTMPAPKQEEKLGTGHGEREASAARWAQFRRASERPNETIAIYYDSYANLYARGIVPTPARAEPDPFPGFRFAPDPKG
jgi:hypothetical protein